ncbi:hypothetical protein Goklo_007374, partial [Gossypium klotzschianum]|nr:hypothetical protein [Gossypium klotzschianum]
MNKSEASEEEARDHIRKLIDATWKKMNEDQIAKSPFSRTFIEVAMNLARISLLMYQNGDGHAIEDKETKDRVPLAALLNATKEICGACGSATKNAAKDTA